MSGSPTKMVLVVLSCCLVFIGCDSYVGIEWINHYFAVGKPSLTSRDDIAEGFYNELITATDWKGKFNNGNANAWEEHWKTQSKGGTDISWVDNVDFAYFAGHGAGQGNVPTGVGRGGGFTFGVNAHDDWVLSAIPNNCEPKWGDKNLEWVVLDVCSALALKSDGGTGDSKVLYKLTDRWANKNVMHGLHHILGFRTVAHDYGTGNRGKYYAKFLLGKQNNCIYTIKIGWMQATGDTEYSNVKGADLRAHSPGCDTENECLTGFGDVSKDPDPDTQWYFYWSWPCNW